MRADRAYELRVSRAMIEVLDISTGEIALFWDVRPDQTRRFAKALRADLVQLEARAFLDKWAKWQQS
ncbi:MAG: hypothetical protein QOI80_210 [Solirubrobacteraceae bacterium]|nr:hypothetical protein [Solirubrobacteraceae bacterium]